MSKTETRGEKTIRASQKAQRYRNSVPFRPFDAYLNNGDAERYQAEADALLQPGELVRGAGEVVRSGSSDSDVQPWMVDTLANLTMVGVNASEQRLEIAAEAGVVEAGWTRRRASRPRIRLKRCCVIKWLLRTKRE